MNTEAPRAVAGLKCCKCKIVIDNIRKFKCYSWTYVKSALLEALRQIETNRMRRQRTCGVTVNRSIIL